MKIPITEAKSTTIGLDGTKYAPDQPRDHGEFAGVDDRVPLTEALGPNSSDRELMDRLMQPKTIKELKVHLERQHDFPDALKDAHNALHEAGGNTVHTYSHKKSAPGQHIVEPQVFTPDGQQVK